jgi:hypothetical protein
MFVLIGGLLGGILGEILRVMAPQGTIQTVFATNFTPGINLLSLLGMFLGIYLHKNV